jgi:hypothetical protein
MRRRLLIIAFVLATSVATAAFAAAPTETIRLHARPGSTVRGSATEGASSAGKLVLLDLHGLAPVSGARALLHAGTCRHFGASFAAIVTAKANAKGSVRTRGHLLFHGLPVDYGSIADGGHVITVVSGSRVVACGVIPGMS